MSKPEGFSNFEGGEKHRRWDEAAERVEQIVDRLGQHLDDGIKEGVIALNVHEINTTGSCEGHLDRGAAAPWIDIQAKISKEEEARYRELLDGGEPSREEFRELRGIIELRNLEEQRKLIPHLDDFYKDRDAPFDRRLILENPALGRLESQGARFQKLEEEKTKKERLEEYQAEMNAFAAFLKERYFAEE